MPAAAVIPALKAYIKVVAVKKLVVRGQFWTGGAGRREAPAPSPRSERLPGLTGSQQSARPGCSSPSVPRRPAGLP